MKKLFKEFCNPSGLIYLASPYSHPDRTIRVERFEAVCRVASELMKRGLYIFSPIAHTHPIAEAGGLPKGWDFWESFDKYFLNAASHLWILKLDGWVTSTGIENEIRLALEMEKSIASVDPSSLAILPYND